MSGGTEGTQYFISGLVKDDGGIATNTGYKKQAVRANIDQDLGSGIQLAVNTNVIHSKSKRGLSNNDNSGHQPVSGVPLYAELLQPGAHERRLSGQSVRAQQPAPDLCPAAER